MKKIFAGFWQFIKKKVVRLWLFRFFGTLWALIETVVAWVITAVILSFLYVGLSYFSDRFPIQYSEIFIISAACGISLIALVYVFIDNMRWARKIAEMSGEEFDYKALMLGFAVTMTAIIGLIGAGLYQLYSWIF